MKAGLGGLQLQIYKDIVELNLENLHISNYKYKCKALRRGISPQRP